MKNLLACWLIVMVGCYTPQKADKHLAKAMTKYPQKVAGLCKDKYPCKPGKTDTIEKVYYDLIEVECPDMTSVRYDTIEKEVVKVITKTIKVPVKVPAKEVIITQYLVDSALVDFYKIKYEELLKDARKCESSQKSRLNIIWALIALVCLLVAWLVIKHRK